MAGNQGDNPAWFVKLYPGVIDSVGFDGWPAVLIAARALAH
jgi:hypothetical protein